LTAEPDVSVDVAAIYDRHAAGYDKARSSNFFEAPWLDRFLTLVAEGATILDVGCGGGEPMARHLIDHGHPVVGLDAAPAMIALARRRFPAQRWVCADMRNLPVNGGFGGILAWDSLFHLSGEEQRSVLAALARHVEPKGALMFTAGPERSVCSGHVEGATVPHASLSPADYACLLDDHGLLLRAFVADDPDCRGHSVYLAQRRV
jgi:2-polyprenyl-3-methyl-5-hydroxy-6-metoxy-1,4-benzoquinol methylase